MNYKENKNQRLSKRMRKIHKLASIMHKLILTEINGKLVFILDNLSQEEKDFINKEWCNAL